MVGDPDYTALIQMNQGSIQRMWRISNRMGWREISEDCREVIQVKGDGGKEKKP